MLKFSEFNFDKVKALNELIQGDGVIVIENIFDQNIINKARLIVNEFADNQEQKESHFNAEAEASGKIQLQQRVWNLFGKDVITISLRNTRFQPARNSNLDEWYKVYQELKNSK